MRRLLFGTQQRQQENVRIRISQASCLLSASKLNCRIKYSEGNKSSYIVIRNTAIFTASFWKCIFHTFSLFPYPNKAKLQSDDTVNKDAGTWHSSYSVINLLISVQNDFSSRANSLSKTWVKYFYVFALAQWSYPTAQWTKSLSDTNNPPTLSSAASLERCQVHWVYVLWGDPSSVWLTCWRGDKNSGLFEVYSWPWHCCWLWVQWVTVKQQVNAQKQYHYIISGFVQEVRQTKAGDGANISW